MNETKPQEFRLKISVSQLLLVSVPIATGLTVKTSSGWPEGLLATGVTALGMHFLSESLQLARVWRSLELSEKSQKFAVTYAIGWRLGATFLFMGCLLQRLLIDRGIIDLNPGTDYAHINGEIFPEFVCKVATTISLLSVAENYCRSSHWFPNYLRLAIVTLAWFFAAIYTGFLLFEQGVVHALTHFAASGIEYSHPLKFQRVGFYLSSSGDGARFFYLALAATLSWILALAFTHLALTYLGSPRRLILNRSLALACGIACIAYCYWYHSTGYPQASPDFASERSLPSGWDIFSFFLLVLTVSLAWAHRLVSNSKKPVHDEFIVLRTKFPILACFAILLSSLLNYLSIFRAANSLIDYYLETFAYLLVYPPAMIVVAMGLAATLCFWRRWKVRSQQSELIFCPLPAGVFVTTTMACMLLISLAAIIAEAFSFAYWVGPWARL